MSAYRAMGLRLALVLVGGSSCVADPCENPTRNTLGELTAWERAYLARPAVELPPAAFLEAEDGLGLAYHDWVPDDWDGRGAVVLLVPGSSAYAELYGALGAGLRARGVLARVIDVRGHGRSVCTSEGECGGPPYPSVLDDGRYFVGRPGDSLDEDQIVRDLARHVADLGRSWPEARIVAVGHSSGGGVVSRFVEYGGLAQVDAVALLAPFNHYEQAQNVDVSAQLCPDTAGTLYAQLDLGALGDALRGNRHRYVLNFVKEAELTTSLDTLRYSYTTMVGMAADGPDDFLAAYVEPTLWVAAERDVLLDLERSRAQFERMPGGGAFVTVLDTSHVGLSWSDAVAALLARWALEPQTVQSGTLAP